MPSKKKSDEVAVKAKRSVSGLWEGQEGVMPRVRAEALAARDLVEILDGVVDQSEDAEAEAPAEEAKEDDGSASDGDRDPEQADQW